MESTLKEKNLLLQEQIHVFKSRPHFWKKYIAQERNRELSSVGPLSENGWGTSAIPFKKGKNELLQIRLILVISNVDTVNAFPFYHPTEKFGKYSDESDVRPLSVRPSVNIFVSAL